MRVPLIFALCTLGTSQVIPLTQPEPTDKDCICARNVAVCTCTLRIEHMLTMLFEDEKALVYPDNGELKMRGSNKGNKILTEDQVKRVITADGEGSRIVIAINQRFPGPRIEVYEDQILRITVINALHTDSVTVHFHGLHQRDTPWMDGVAFITQCPVLPGQTFVYQFKAYPPGTNMYHAHIADQRSMGLYGAVIVRPKQEPLIRGFNEIIITLQDWNHLMDSDTAYHRMLTEQFDFSTGNAIPTSYSVDKANFSRFEFQSGLVNGKGRFWSTSYTNNGNPLERFLVAKGTLFRIRVIGAMTIYPMRVFIEGERLTLRTSDAYNLEPITVQSIIVHPGERYDFYWTAPSEPASKTIMFVAQTIETLSSINYKYHAAEAVFVYTDLSATAVLNPYQAVRETCSADSNCVTFNCPYSFYPLGSYRTCLTFNDVRNNDPIRNPLSVLGEKVDNEYFFNFAFPGTNGKTPGSINGREFVFPTISLLTQRNELSSDCNENKCDQTGVCNCTYIQKIPSNKLIQMVLFNLGTGSGWSHPVHLHGHSFYVMKMGLGLYNNTTGVLLAPTSDITCVDSNGYCSSAQWSNTSWAGGNVPNMNYDPPEKDTIIVPTGGYVVIRFVSDNPGMWFLHCHIDLHNTNGMAMVIDEGDTKPAAPAGFPTCRNFMYNGQDPGNSSPENQQTSGPNNQQTSGPNNQQTNIGSPKVNFSIGFFLVMYAFLKCAL